MGGPLVAGMLGPSLDGSRPPAAPPATPAAPSLMRVKAAAQVEDQVRPRVQRSRVDVHGRGLLPGPCIRPDGRWLSRPALDAKSPGRWQARGSSTSVFDQRASALVRGEMFCAELRSRWSKTAERKNGVCSLRDRRRVGEQAERGFRCSQSERCHRARRAIGATGAQHRLHSRHTVVRGPAGQRATQLGNDRARPAIAGSAGGRHRARGGSPWAHLRPGRPRDPGIIGDDRARGGPESRLPGAVRLGDRPGWAIRPEGRDRPPCRCVRAGRGVGNPRASHRVVGPPGSGGRAGRGAAAPPQPARRVLGRRGQVGGGV
jgi:hypothetical protein